MGVFFVWRKRWFVDTARQNLNPKSAEGKTRGSAVSTVQTIGDSTMCMTFSLPNTPRSVRDVALSFRLTEEVRNTAPFHVQARPLIGRVNINESARIVESRL